MKKQIKELIETLHHEKVNVKLDATQLAEALWLAEHIGLKTKRDEVKKESLIDKLKELFNKVKKLLAFHKYKNDEAQKSENQTTTLQEKVFEKEEKRATLSLPKHDRNSKDSEYILTPKKRDIFVTEKLLKSLLWLKLKSLSGKKKIFVESETVEFVAKTGLIRPLFKRKKESYFELFLIIDDSPSMEIWKDSLSTFEKKLRVYKIFNKITPLYLDSRTKKAMLFTDKEKKIKCNLNIFKNLNQRALTFILTDMVSLAWRETTALSLVYELQMKIPTILINMLPYRMWDGTILEHSNKITLEARRSYVLNKNLKSKVDRKLLKLDENYFKNNKVLKLPIVNLNEQDFFAMINVIKGKNENSIGGIVVNLDKIKAKEILLTDEVSTDDRVQNYYDNASDRAINLAKYMAVVKKLNISIMQIIQKTMLKDSNQTHLAEFFLGGLLHKSAEGDFYEFKEGVDEVLAKELGNLKIHETLYKVSDEIAKEVGSTLDFKALLNTGFGGEDSFDKNDEIFAYISPKTLRRLGGKYAKIADTITGVKKVEEKYVEDYIYHDMAISRPSELTLITPPNLKTLHHGFRRWR